MKKFTILLFVLLAGAFAMQVSAQDEGPTRATIYSTLPDDYQQLGDSKIYYSIANRYFAGVQRLITEDGPGFQYGISILGEIDGQFYSSTYGTTQRDDGCGSGFLGAFKVGSYNAEFLNSLTGTESHGVKMTAAIEAVGEVAAKITYTLTNNNNQTVTVSAGVYGDIMIGNNDYAPVSRLKNDENQTYGLKLKESVNEENHLFCALFGEGVTGVTEADDYWFGQYNHNFSPDQIVGDYSNVIIDRPLFDFWDTLDEYYMIENGNYDSGMGFCWKNREIPAGESIELSFLISVGEIEFEEPFVPGDDRFEYEVEAYNIDAWNDLGTGHPGHVFGYYEHPYGQEGYIEYQVDGGEWIRIDDVLVSGEEFDLEFIMRFDLENTTLHVLNLRFTDGLGNYTPMTGLSWVDVRSFDVEGFEDGVYNGEPQTFVGTVNGENCTIGEDGEYVNPGNYFYQILGDYYENTIGVLTIEFAIDKGQPDIMVVVPDNVEYDGEDHGATIIVNAGPDPIVTYVNTMTGVESTEAPVEVGVYMVIVEVPENEFYYGIEPTGYGPYEIYIGVTAVNEISVDKQDGAWYTIDGRRVAAPAEPGIYIHNGKKYIVK